MCACACARIESGDCYYDCFFFSPHFKYLYFMFAFEFCLHQCTHKVTDTQREPCSPSSVCMVLLLLCVCWYIFLRIRIKIDILIRIFKRQSNRHIDIFSLLLFVRDLLSLISCHLKFIRDQTSRMKRRDRARQKQMHSRALIHWKFTNAKI